jgi:hypothetical protein
VPCWAAVRTGSNIDIGANALAVAFFGSTNGAHCRLDGSRRSILPQWVEERLVAKTWKETSRSSSHGIRRQEISRIRCYQCLSGWQKP